MDRLTSKERKTSWLSQTFAERVTFSSFCTTRDAVWAQDLPRPYEIVALPGVKGPQGVSRDDRDAMWLEESGSEPVVVWDGFCPVLLHEVILECFDPRGAGQAYLVRDAETGEVIPEPRHPGIMELRPEKSGAPNNRHDRFNRVLDLTVWAAFIQFAAKGAGPMPSVHRTYQNIISSDMTAGSECSHPDWGTWKGEVQRAIRRDTRLDDTRPPKQSPVARGTFAFAEPRPSANTSNSIPRTQRLAAYAELQDFIAARPCRIDVATLEWLLKDVDTSKKRPLKISPSIY